MRKGRFAIDDGTRFDGFTKGETWNGWACPLFTREEVERIAEEFGPAYYDAESDTFDLSDVDGDEDTFTGEDVIIDGETVHVYPIGSKAWVWEEI